MFTEIFVLSLPFTLPLILSALFSFFKCLWKASEERNAAEEARRRAAEKERIAAEKAAEQERVAAEKEAEKKRAAAEKAAERKRAAAEKAAAKMRATAERERIAAEKAAAREAERERILQQRHENAMRRAEEMHALRLRQENELKAAKEIKAVEEAKAVEKTKATEEVKSAAEVKTAPRVNASKPFAGESIAFTGTCPKLSRSGMITHTNRLGGHGYDTINTRCTLLVVGEKPGKNQLESAAKWNIKTITWQEWYKRAFGESSLPTPEPVKGISLDDFAKTLDAA